MTLLLAIAVSLLLASRAHAVSDDFSTNPLAGGSPWSFGLGSNANGQFSWSPGELTVHIDTSLPTARLDLPLGITLGDSSSFLLSARFSFHVTSAPGDQFGNLSFGLTNHTLSGGDRTGTPMDFNSANTYHTVEFDYFPNVSDIFGGPTLSPAVFGGPDGSAFNNFASIFGPDSVLGDNTVGVTSLTQDVPLEAQLAYDGGTKTLTLNMYSVGPSESLTLINTELVPLDIDAFGTSYDPFNPFQVDTLSIMAYQDGFTTPQAPSLLADVTFHSIGVSLVPEPSALVLSSLGLLGVAAMAVVRGRRRRSELRVRVLTR
ncbi:MAG: hypothetical protein AB7O59_16265 [Pirellulales bacterium]